MLGTALNLTVIMYFSKYMLIKGNRHHGKVEVPPIMDKTIKETSFFWITLIFLLHFVSLTQPYRYCSS